MSWAVMWMMMCASTPQHNGGSERPTHAGAGYCTGRQRGLRIAQSSAMSNHPPLPPLIPVQPITTLWKAAAGPLLPTFPSMIPLR